MHDTPPALARLIAAIDALSAAMGHAAAVATSAVVLLTAGLVLAFSFGKGSVPVQDAILWLNATLVLLGLSYALKTGSHVRIDVLSAHWSAKTRARVELAGIVLLLWPFAGAIGLLSVDYVAASWRISERSGSSGGLAGLWLVKTLLPAGAALLALQGLAEALRALPVALGRAPAGRDA